MDAQLLIDLILYYVSFSINSEWTQSDVLLDSSDGAPYAQFGTSVCLSNEGTTLAIGAAGYSKQVTHGGAVYIYQLVQLVQPAFAQFTNIRPAVDTNSNTTEVAPPESVGQYGFILQSVLSPDSLQPYANFGHQVAFRDYIGELNCILK